jgi:hypothetical protein
VRRSEVRPFTTTDQVWAFDVPRQLPAHGG